MSVQTIAVVGAMERKIEPLRESMSNVKHVSFGRFSAYEGGLAGKRMVLVLSGIGKVSAVVSMSWAIHQFTSDCVINTGSTGGLSKGLKVGDVAIGETVAHHDVDMTAFDCVRGQAPQLPAVFASNVNLVRQTEKAAQVFEGVAVTQGLVVSDDHFAHNSEGITEIRSHSLKVKTVEMETAAIAQTCHQSGVPFVIIRAISDSADEKADISFEEFLKTAAVSSAKMVIETVKSL